MTNFIRTEKVVNINGMLWRHIWAQKTCRNAPAPLMVARLCEDGRQVSRNLDYCGMFGWRFTAPGQVVRGYCGNWTATLDAWGKYTPRLDNVSCWKPTDSDKAAILSKYPEFRWVLAKVNWNTSTIFKALKLWKKDARLMETLVSMDCRCLALNGSLYVARDKWNIVKWISKNLDHKYCCLYDIRLMMKGVPYETVDTYRRTTAKYNYVTFEEWQYLFDKKLGPSFYRDYKEMAKKAGHDLKDPYWHYPKDLKKAHDKVMKECQAIDAIKKAEELKRKQAEYTAKVKKWLSKTFEADGLKVFIQGDLAKWADHAKKLHQCIVANKYDEKMIRGECVLVFITKEGRPYATAELKPAGKGFRLGQFYGNERLKDYKAKPDAVRAFNNWVKENNIKVAA